MVLQGGFVISNKVFGCDDATCNPSPVQELSLLTQFSGITTPAVLSFRVAMQGGLTKPGLVYEE